MDLKQKVVLNSRVFVQEVDDEIVLLDSLSENYFGLDEVGASFWRAMQKEDSLESVLDVLLNEYDVSRDILLKDLEIFLHKLQENNLIDLEI